MSQRTTFLVALLALQACNCTSTSTVKAPAAQAPNGASDQAVAEPTEPTEPPAAATIALPEIPAPDPREPAIAVAVQQLLQTQHLLAKPVDDAVSQKAAERFIEHLDPGKLYLLQSHVAELSRHALRLDDELAAGELRLARLGSAMVAEQRQKVAAIVARLLSEPLDLAVQESLETDPDKRKHAATDAELEDLWRKNLKQQVLQRVARMEKILEHEAEAEKKKQSKPPRKAGKASKAGAGAAPGKADASARKDPVPATDEARRTKAREELAAQYAGRFTRLASRKPLEAVETFVNAITGIFDPHTHYLAPEDQANFDIQMSGSLEGIGAVLTEDDHYIEIREIVPGGAAWRQGDLEAGDLIMAVKQTDQEPVDVADMRLSEVVKLIRGPKGTLVTLTVRKPDDEVANIEITRDVIVVEASYARGAILNLGDGHRQVGYIYLPSFYGNTRSSKGLTPDRNAVDDVRALLQHFERKKMGAVLLDLRGNGGGLLSQANDITGLFIEEGPVVQARGAGDDGKVLGDEDPKIYFGGQVVTLVDRFSASASEILAGALQDYGRAVIVGTGPTHGKGTVQMLVDLDRAMGNRGKPLGVLKLTVQQYFLVDGESTQLRGVQPDVVLTDPAAYIESGERFLDNAIPWSSVKPLAHTPWPRPARNTAQLATQSLARQAAEQVFARMEARSTYLAKRREDTVVPLNRDAWRAKQEADDKALKALDPNAQDGDEDGDGDGDGDGDEAEDKRPVRFSVDVVEYRPAKPKAPAGAREDTGARIERWREGLARDPWIAESLHVLDDMAAGAK